MQLAINTAQRESDILVLTWGQCNGRTIKLTQQKTTLEIPVHPDLKQALDRAKTGSSDGTVVALPPRPDSPMIVNETFSGGWNQKTVSAAISSHC